MTVIVKARNSFDVVQLNSVTSITYATGTYTIIHSGGTSTYLESAYIVHII